jgi:hypothetical protein
LCVFYSMLEFQIQLLMSSMLYRKWSCYYWIIRQPSIVILEPVACLVLLYVPLRGRTSVCIQYSRCELVLQTVSRSILGKLYIPASLTPPPHTFFYRFFVFRTEGASPKLSIFEPRQRKVFRKIIYVLSIVVFLFDVQDIYGEFLLNWVVFVRIRKKYLRIRNSDFKPKTL